MRQLLLCFLFLLLSVKLFPQLLINEFSSSNISKLSDEDGEYNDWIELYNYSPAEVDLGGYHLSDDEFNLKKWTFPGLILRPYSYLLVFASDKNRIAVPMTYKTILSRGEVWRYIVPASEIGDQWKNLGFNASSWQTGSSGFGYGDSDDQTVLNNIVSVYIRKEFTISSIQDIEEVVLSIDYDDGFVAYINGHEIARSNVGTINPVPFNQATGAAQREATMYPGGLPENFIIENPASFLVEGVNVIAIQGHNTDPASSDFSLIPMLSIGRASAGSPDSVPSYIALTGRSMHTNFKISDEGETLILSRPDSSVVDSVSPVIMPADLSYGRKPDGTDSWFYFAASTPGSANTTNGFDAINGDTVIFSSRGGYYPGGLSLQLSSVYLSDSIFYTLDGSEPTTVSLRYVNPITLANNAVVRAMSIKSDRLPGAITTATYITKQHTMPVVSISTDPENLWNYNTGIYVNGPNALPDFPYFNANFWQDWERKGHMELYDVKGIKQLDQDIGIKIFGNWSRANPQKSMALFARKIYGKGSFDYKVFTDKPIEKFESLVLRNTGNDWGLGMVRDGLTSTLIRDMDIDRQAYQPSVVYLNGAYWGIQDIREKINSSYLAENHYANPDNVNLLELDGTAIEGTNAGYTELINYLANNSLETEQKYQLVSRKIDLNNYMQYQLTQIYINNKDWPGNNIKFWNTNDPSSLWRWIIYDTDFGFSIWEESAYSFNTLSFALEPSGVDWPNPAWATLLFRRMVSNQGFRDEFVNQYADRLNTNFSAETVNATIDSIKQYYLPEIHDQLSRWGLYYDTWDYNYNIIKSYATNRPYFARIHLKSKFNLGEMLNIRVEIDDPATGSVRINSVVPKKYPFDGVYFKDLPIKLTAIPAPGYKFVRWEIGSVVSNSVTLKYNMEERGNFLAVFEASGNTDTRLVINEINYNSSPIKDTKDWIELYNAGNSTVNLKNWIISDGGPETGFVIPEDHIMAPGMYIVICREQAAFRQFWPNVSGITGDMQFGLSSTGDDINLYDTEGNLIDFVTYSPYAPWPTDVNTTGASIELTNPLSDNNAGKNWRSGLIGGTPGAKNFQDMPTDSIDGETLTKCRLSCFPNPFSDYTTMKVELPVPGRFRIEIFNIQGKPVTTLTDQSIDAGEYYIDWYGKGNNNAPLPGGVYIIRLSGENQHYTTRVIIMK